MSVSLGSSLALAVGQHASELEVRVQLYRDELEHFVAESWRTNAGLGEGLPLYMSGLIARALKSPRVRTLLLVDKQDPDLAIGWICCSDDMEALHFIYIKPQYRRLGLSRLLLEAAFAFGPARGRPRCHTFETRCLKWLKLSTSYFPYALQLGEP